MQSVLNSVSSLLAKTTVVSFFVLMGAVFGVGGKALLADQPAQTVPLQWKPCSFGGDGPVTITAGLIRLELGDPITGVHCQQDIPTTNYQVDYEAQRTDGFDFFGALTFPVGDGHATLVPGGWGGGVFGLSSINGSDASDNETTQYVPLDSDQWYAFTVRVTDQRVSVWLDGEQKIDVVRADKEFSLRGEMEVCQPLGMAAFQCDAEIRNIVLTTFPADHPPAPPVKRVAAKKAAAEKTSQNETVANETVAGEDNDGK